MIRWGSVREFVIDCLKKNYYIFTLVDQSYFLNVKYRRLHEIFVYGVDLEKNVAFVADFLKGKYSFLQVDFDLLCKGIRAVKEQEDYWDDRGGIYLIKYIENIGYDYHPRFMKEAIYSYLHPDHVYSYIDGQTTRFKNNPIHYGIDVYDQLIEHIYSICTHHYMWDKRAFHNLFDHKKLMVLRVNWLIDEEYIKISEDLAQKFQEIEKQAEVLCNWSIKLNLQGAKGYGRIPEKMISILKQMKEREKILYEALVDAIES